MAVFVSGFDFDTAENAIEAHCATVGKVSSVELVGRGAATVRFVDPVSAKYAIEELNETTIDGNRRFINVRAEGEKGKKGGKSYGKGGERCFEDSKGRKGGKGDYDDRYQQRRAYTAEMKLRSVFVSGFDFDTPESAIEEHCVRSGKVSCVELVGRGAAVVEFEDPASAKYAIEELNETTIEGNHRYINVWAEGDKGDKGRKGGKGYGKGGDYEDREGKKGGKGYKDRYEQRKPYTGDMQTGTVSKFLSDRGFGYITPDRGEGDVFVHFSAIEGDGFRSLEQDQRVRFGVEPDPKGKGKGAVKAVAVSAI